MAEKCIVKILGKDATSFPACFYNEMKVAQGTAKCVAMRNFGDLEKYFIHSPVVVSNYLQKIADHNSMVKHKQKHMVFSFPGKATPEQIEQLLKDAAETMDRLGYKGQPQIYYVHNDTDYTHIHVVSVTVSVKDGMWIDNWQEGRRARRFLDNVRGINYRSEIDKLFDYKFESREQFKSLLLANGYRCHLDEENGSYDIYRNHDFVGSLLTDEIDNVVAANGRNKDNHKDVIKDLRGKLMDNRRRSLKLKYNDPIEVTTKKGKHTITRRLAEVKGNRFNGEKGLDIEGERKAQFKQFLVDIKQKLGIFIVFSQWKDGQTKGYTIIDNKNKMVFKGSDVVDLQKLLNPEWKKGMDKDIVISANDASSMADEISMDKNLPQFIEQQLEKLGVEVSCEEDGAMSQYGSESEQENRDKAVNSFNLLKDMIANQDDLTEEGEQEIGRLAAEAIGRAICADSQYLQKEEQKAREEAEKEARASEQEKAQQRAVTARTMTGDRIGSYVIDILADYNIGYNLSCDSYNSAMTEALAVQKSLNYLETAIQKRSRTNASFAVYYARCAEESAKKKAEEEKAKPKARPENKQHPSAPATQDARVVPFVKIEPTIFIGDDRRTYIKVDINSKSYQPKAISAEQSVWYQQQVNKKQAAQDLALHFYANEIQKAQVYGWKEQHFEAGKMPFGITVGKVWGHANTQGDKFWVDGDFTHDGQKMETSSYEISKSEYVKFVNSDGDAAKSVVCKSVGRELVKDWSFNSITDIKNALFDPPSPESSINGVRESIEVFGAVTEQLRDQFIETCGKVAVAYFNALLPSDQSIGGGGGQSTGNWRGKKDDDDWWKRGGGIMGFQPPKKKTGDRLKR